jgi:sugar lactone lactonase YvrE
MKIKIRFNYSFIAVAMFLLISSCKKTNSSTPAAVSMVTTFAGTGTAGLANGTGTAASFNNLSDLAIGSDGKLYAGDWANNLIRTIDLNSALVTTFAGTGIAGLVNGPKAAAQFNGTAHIAFDNAGNLFVSDEENNVIREITSAGNVITVAGSGIQGYQDGPVATARFSHPEGIVVDANGNLYVADGNGSSNVIRKITAATGLVSTFAGIGTSGYHDGAASTASFNSPYGMTMDGSGNIYVADIGNNVIRKITVATATVSTYAGSGARGFSNGPAATASFYFPAACVFDKNGNMFIADLFNNAVRKLSAGGTVSTYAGTGVQGAANGVPSQATFNHPIALAVDASGNVYVADQYNSDIRKISVGQ